MSVWQGIRTAERYEEPSGRRNSGKTVSVYCFTVQRSYEPNELEKAGRIPVSQPTRGRLSRTGCAVVY